MKTFMIVWNLRQISSFKVSNVPYSTLRGAQPAIVKSKTNASHYLNLKNQKCRSFNWQGLKNLWDVSFSWFPISILGGDFSLIKNLTIFNVKKYDHSKEVCLITHHFKYHPSVSRSGLVQRLTKTIQAIPGSNTKLVYIVGLPGTGKKELTRQYAESHFKKLSASKTSGVFVAMINASNPEIFHQDLLKLSEKIGIADYFTKAEKDDGLYHKVLCKIASHLEQTSNWLLVLNDIKLDGNLKWLIGERHVKQQKVKNHIDLSNSLPSPSDPSNGTILITTCDSFAYGHRASNTTSFNMPNGMENDEALELLQFGSDIGGLHQCKSAIDVVNTLGNVPTSVYCAGLAVQIKTNNPVSTPEEVEVLFDSLHRDILSKNFSNILSMASRERIDKLKYPQKMQNMQKLAVQDVAKSDKLRKKAFTLLACCAPAAVPPQFVYSVVGKWINKRELFIDHLIYGREESETNMSGKARNFLSWLTNLFGSSESSNSELINYEVIKVSEGYHEIFQEVFLADIKKVLHSKLFKKSVESLIDYYNENNRKDDIDTITTRKLLLPHIQSFLNLIEIGKDIITFQIYEPYLADLYYCLGSAYVLEGDLTRPVNYFDKSLKLYEKQDNRLGEIKVYIQLGKAYRDISKQYKSIEALEKAELLLNSHPNRSNYELLVHRYKLFRYKGDANASIGKYKESLKYFAQCLEVLQEMDETSETKHFSLLIYLKLVSIHRKNGNSQLYRHYMKKSEEILNDLYQEDMPLLEAELGLQRAVLLRNSCLPKESICILKEVLAIFKDIYGKKHIKVALIESELSISLRRNGDLKESEEMALSALEKLQERDIHHYERTKVLYNLGSTYTYLGKYDDAEKCFDQALEIANQNLFDINRQAWVIKKSEILEQKGIMKRKKGEIIASLELLKQCVDLKRKLYCPSNPYHPDFAEALVSLGKTQHRVGLLAESLESLCHAENIRKKYYGENYPQTIFVKSYQARVLRDAGDNEESFKKIDGAILQYEKQIKSAGDMDYLEERPEYISMYATKGLLEMDAMLKTAGENITDSQYYGLNEARKTLIKALTVQHKHAYKSLLQEVEIECILGRVYCLLKEQKKAMELFKKTYEAISKIDKNHPLSASVQANWSRVYYESGDLQNAINLLENAWKIRNNYMHSELHPNSLIYSYYLGEYYKEIRNMKEAAKWYSSAINGYSYLISEEDLRVSNLKQPHVILQWSKLPVYETWYQYLENCRCKYEEVLSSF